MKKSTISLNSDLKVIQENEEETKNYEKEEEGHYSEEEALGYNSNYKLHQNSKTNKGQTNMQDLSLKRKTSTLSTAISLTDTFSENNSLFSPKKKKFDIKTGPSIPQQTFFGRGRLNSTPVTTYYEGMDFYFREMQPEKSEYKKSNNFIEKEIFFKENGLSYKDFKYKSFDLSEQNKFNSNQILKSIEENNNMPQTPQTTINLKNSIQYNNINININNNCNINNNINGFTPLTKIKFNNNSLYGKFDMPMYYVGYYNVDCKCISSYLFYFNFSVQRDPRAKIQSNGKCRQEY